MAIGKSLFASCLLALGFRNGFACSISLGSFYLFDESIGGFTAGGDVVVGMESMFLKSEICCKNLCCFGRGVVEFWPQVKYLFLCFLVLRETAQLSWNVVAGTVGVGVCA